MWLLHAQQPRGMIIACHGYYATRFQLMPLAEHLRAGGYSVAVFDFPAHGTREGRCTFGREEVADIGAILEHIRREPRTASLPVGLLGWSFGGVVACQAAQQIAGIRALVLDSAYARLFPILAHAIRRDYHLPSVPFAWISWLSLQVALRDRLRLRDPSVVAARLPHPVLLIHGEADRSVPVEHARIVYERWRGPKERWLEPEVGHVGMYAADPARYCRRVIAFFDQWLTAPNPSSPS